MPTTSYRAQPFYTPDDFAPLEYDEEMTEVLFEEDDEDHVTSIDEDPDEDRPVDD